MNPAKAASIWVIALFLLCLLGYTTQAGCDSLSASCTAQGVTCNAIICIVPFLSYGLAALTLIIPVIVWWGEPNTSVAPPTRRRSKP